MEKGRESGPSSAAYPTWDIRSRASSTEDCMRSKEVESPGGGLSTFRHAPLGDASAQGGGSACLISTFTNYTIYFLLYK